MFRMFCAVSGEERAKKKKHLGVRKIFRSRVTRVVKEFDVQLP